MPKKVSPSKSLTPRLREWLEHLRAWREQGGSLRAYALANELSVSGLYTARRVLAKRGAWPDRSEQTLDSPAPKLVPVQVTSLLAAAPSPFRVLLPNGAVVEVPQQADPARCRALLACVSEALQ